MISILAEWLFIDANRVLVTVFALPGLDLVFVLKEEVDIVESVHQAVFLVAVDFKRLALA